MSDALARLQAWYAAQCDGDWEHQGGVRIGTLDNPGWALSVRIEGTELENRPFLTLEESYEHDDDWVRCWVADNVFHGVGGPRRLGRILEVFLAWADEKPTQTV